MKYYQYLLYIAIAYSASCELHISKVVALVEIQNKS